MNHSLIRRLAIALAISAGLLFCGSERVSALVLADYPFDNLSSVDTNAFSVATDFSGGSGVNALSSGTGNPGPSYAMQNASATTAANAVTNNDYLEFSIAPITGFELNLTSLTLQYQRSGVSSPTNLFIRSSIDGYTASLFSDASLPTASFESGNANLTGASFQGLTESITFRIYAFGGTTGSPSLRIDNVKLNGDAIAVPETGAGLLLSGGLLSWFGWRRPLRKRSKSET